MGDGLRAIQSHMKHTHEKKKHLVHIMHITLNEKNTVAIQFWAHLGDYYLYFGAILTHSIQNELELLFAWWNTILIHTIRYILQFKSHMKLLFSTWMKCFCELFTHLLSKIHNIKSKIQFRFQIRFYFELFSKLSRFHAIALHLFLGMCRRFRNGCERC